MNNEQITVVENGVQVSVIPAPIEETYTIEKINQTIEDTQNSITLRDLNKKSFEDQQTIEKQNFMDKYTPENISDTETLNKFTSYKTAYEQANPIE